MGDSVIHNADFQMYILNKLQMLKRLQRRSNKLQTDFTNSYKNYTPLSLLQHLITVMELFSFFLLPVVY